MQPAENDWGSGASSVHARKPLRQICQRWQFGEAGMGGRARGVLVGPDEVIGNEGGVAARFERRQNVRAHGIAGHRGMRGAGAVAREDADIGVGFLLAHDLHA